MVAAALHLGLPPTKRTHPAKVEQARQLAAAHGLSDIDDLLVELNDRRKLEAYGDIELPADVDGDAQGLGRRDPGQFRGGRGGRGGAEAVNGQATTERPQVVPACWEAAVCSWPDNGARDWARDLMKAARRSGTVNAVVATGSAVRDVDRGDDLDLVLVYHTVRPPLPKAPISVDLRCYELADVASRLAAGHSYLSWAVRFGRVLFERDC